MNNTSSGGVGILGVIFWILLFLKIFGLITISWWWVFSPLIAGFVLALLVIILTIVAATTIK